MLYKQKFELYEKYCFKQNLNVFANPIIKINQLPFSASGSIGPCHVLQFLFSEK
jgi:hypothetical protein